MHDLVARQLGQLLGNLLRRRRRNKLAVHSLAVLALERAGRLLNKARDVAYSLADRARLDAVLLVVLLLQGSAPARLVYGLAHRVRDLVRIHDDLAAHVARRASHGLDE